MDWILIGAIVVAAWVMLSVLSSDRLGKAQQIAVALAKAAATAEQAKPREGEIPIARSAGGPVAGSIGNGQGRKAA